MGKPTNVLIAGNRTTTTKNSNPKKNNQFVSTTTSTPRAHTISLTTSYEGTLSELQNVKLKIVGSTSRSNTLLEDGLIIQTGRNNGWYIRSNGEGTAISMFNLNGVKPDSVKPIISTS
ncbi:hypothetical protein [Streptococcus hyointestinalis]|uniref:hypothetical protein n=1 Tax=Streptococcus hyointestinalis TaxID=1337 RepID=UPI0024067910|nr:hypothetical protein [Streptococcus hyointestinalis]